MKRNHSRALRRSLCGALPFAVALLVGWASPASAVRVIDVRVGQHGEFTRIVFDLDGPARYRLERSEAGAGVPELVVHFDASAQPKVVRTLSKIVDGVRLEARPEGAVARIALRSRDVHAVEETLSSPPRIVIDLRAATQAEVAAAKRPAGAPPRTPEPVAPEAAAAPPQPAAAPPPAAARTAPRTTAQLIEAQADAAAARLLGEQGATKPGEAPAPPPAALAGPSAPAPAAPAASAESAPAPTESASAPPPPAPSPQPEPPREAGNPPGTLGAPPPPPPPSMSPFWSEPGAFVTGAVLIVLALFVWFIFRRREPKEDVHAGALPADAFLDRMAAFGEGSERAAEEYPEDTQERTEALPLFAAASASERTVEIPASREGGGSGHEGSSLFGEPSGVTSGTDKGVTAADLEHPSPALGERVASTGLAPAPHTDESIGRMLREVEQRLAQIEQRLARDADARERLERQVVAQTEELRVQRAAIARTQRVLRTLSRPEDLATEPVIKSPGPSSGSPD
jgi:hypothetical protein